MSSAQEQIVHTIVEGFKEQRIDALDWLRHKILGALINADAARDAEIARLREALKPFAEAGDQLEESDRDRYAIWEHSAAMTIKCGDLRKARSALEASHDEKPEGK